MKEKCLLTMTVLCSSYYLLVLKAFALFVPLSPAGLAPPKCKQDSQQEPWSQQASAKLNKVL